MRNAKHVIIIDTQTKSYNQKFSHRKNTQIGIYTTGTKLHKKLWKDELGWSFIYFCVRYVHTKSDNQIPHIIKKIILLYSKSLGNINNKKIVKNRAVEYLKKIIWSHENHLSTRSFLLVIHFKERKKLTSNENKKLINTKKLTNIEI